MNTLLVLPLMIALFVVTEFRVKPKVTVKYFNFLDSYLGKGLYLMLMQSIIMEKGTIVEWIFFIANSTIAVLNILAHFMNPLPREADR